MKKTIKQLFTLLFTLMIVITASINVKADNEIVKEDTYYIPYYPKVKAFKIPPEPVSSSYDQKIVALGISNKSIATISSKKNSDGQYVVYLAPKKTGSVNISYDVGGVTHQQKIIVKKYQNPYSKVMINGKNITKQFKKTNVAVVSYKKYKNKKVTIKYKMKKNFGQSHTDYCYKGKISKCIGSFVYKASVKKPKKNATVEASIFNGYDETVNQYSVVIFK